VAVETGLDRLLRALRTAERDDALGELPQRMRAARVGFVTNHSAVTRDLGSGVDALGEAGVRLAALFGPEHGVRGEAAAGQKVESGLDARTGVPVYSLYGATREPTPEMLAGLDLMLFDIQDVGARFYTYQSTLSHVMRACGRASVPVIVLDRPNPLGGLVTEGPILEAEQASFVGLHPIPIRHGLTMGELARLSWLEAVDGVGSHGSPVGCSLAEHADARDGPCLSGYVPVRRHGCVGRPWDQPTVRMDRSAVDRS
jgi:uncharacterized protein YbbC (DUF1343 family)